MSRAHFLVIGLALGLALAWASAARPRDDAGKTHEQLEHTRLRQEVLGAEIDRLRQDVKILRESVGRISNANLAKESSSGRITQIDPADDTLVEVNLGADAGLEKHATLEIFRVGQGEEYVGAMRIFEVYSRRALCRLLSTNPLTKPTVHVGDCVRYPRN
jgi:hypothetical protein